MINIAIFASGNGSNAQRIAEYFEQSQTIHVCRIYCNNPDAYVIQRAKKLEIPVTIFNKSQLSDKNEVASVLLADHTDWIVLAGFLWLIPDHIIKSYDRRIINIHPALLPKYGGKGMYGSKVHEAVIQNGESESGITIHYVNEFYDEGQVIFQARYTMKENETPESLAEQVHLLEYEHYPKVIEKVLLSAPLD